MPISTMLVFLSLVSLVRNSVVLAVYLLFSVAGHILPNLQRYHTACQQTCYKCYPGRHPKLVTYISCGGIINGREYSQHAMERMAPDTPSVRAELSRRAEALAESKGLQVGTQEYYQFCQKYVDPRNIPPSVIEDAIRNTTAVPGHTAGTKPIVFYLPLPLVEHLRFFLFRAHYQTLLQKWYYYYI